MSRANHSKVSVQVVVPVRVLQWEQSHMYAGCSGHNRICMQVVVGTVAYVHELH